MKNLKIKILVLVSILSCLTFSATVKAWDSNSYYTLGSVATEGFDATPDTIESTLPSKTAFTVWSDFSGDTDFTYWMFSYGYDGRFGPQPYIANYECEDSSYSFCSYADASPQQLIITKWKTRAINSGDAGSAKLKLFKHNTDYSDDASGLTSEPVTVQAESDLKTLEPGKVNEFDVNLMTQSIGGIGIYTEGAARASDAADYSYQATAFIDGDAATGSDSTASLVASLRKTNLEVIYATDFDGDNIADPLDNDDDSDGIVDSSDNCISTYNPDQKDLDGDGFGLACDTNGYNSTTTTSNGGGSTSTPSKASVSLKIKKAKLKRASNYVYVTGRCKSANNEQVGKIKVTISKRYVSKKRTELLKIATRNTTCSKKGSFKIRAKLSRKSVSNALYAQAIYAGNDSLQAATSKYKRVRVKSKATRKLVS